MIVATTAGKVEGIAKDGVLQFRGVPFAKAERFRAPKAPVPWDGVQKCDRFCPVAPQSASPLEQMMGAKPAAYSESECLGLNVFTPALDGARPVMVWIHGGAFQAGTGSTPWYSGSRLAAVGDVVVVTINYRLGPLGFMHLGGFLDDPEFAGSGNNGIRDQIAALEWVQDNIAGFGGDPRNVTIFGESAGGMSVGVLLGTPGAAGLFHRAIPQSGAASNCLSAADAEESTARALDRLGIEAGDAERLLSIPVEDLLSVVAELLAQGSPGGGPVMPFAPVVDGVVLPESPLAGIGAGSASNVPVLIGTTAEEFRLFTVMDRARGGIDDDRLVHRATKLFGERAPEALNLYRATLPIAEPMDVWCAMATDWVFRIPAVRLAEAQLAAGGSVWTYLFSYKSRAFDGALGACHAIDIPFAFDNLHRRGIDMLLGPVGDDTRALGISTSRAWLSMARSGFPAHESLPDWPTYDKDDRAVMNLDTRCEVVYDPGDSERELWASLV